MQKGNGAIELDLGLAGAGDGKINATQGVPGVWLNRVSCHARAATEPDDGQDGSSARQTGIRRPGHA
jgi:hypothetical protein